MGFLWFLYAHKDKIAVPILWFASRRVFALKSSFKVHALATHLGLGEASVEGKLWRHTGRKSFQRRNSSVSFLVFVLAKTAKMPDRSVVYGCSNAKEPWNGISLHKIPFHKNDGSVAKARRKKWVDLVRSAQSGNQVCSCHFAAQDFAQKCVFAAARKKTAAANKGRHRVCCYATISEKFMGRRRRVVPSKSSSGL